MQRTTNIVIRDMYYRLRSMGLSIKDSYEQVSLVTGFSLKEVVELLECKEVSSVA